MNQTSDYQIVERKVNDYRTYVTEFVLQRRVEITQPDNTVISMWVDQPFIKL